MATITFPFDTELNYIKTSLLEFSSGKCQVSDKTPINTTCGATYTNDINLQGWSKGPLTGTAVGGAGVVLGELDLAHGDKRYVNYDAVDNANSQQIITIKFKYRPNFVTPIGEHIILLITKEYNSLINGIFYRDTGSHHKLHIYDSSGVLIEECYFGYKQWVQGQQYEIEFDVDITTGAIRMFIDGVQFGATKTSTGTRDGDINLFRIGCNYQDSTNSNFKISDVVVYDTIQHTTNYTPGYTLPESKYPQESDNQKVYPATIFRTDELNNDSQIASTNIRRRYRYGLQEYYWNGSAWTVSDESWSQSNDIVDLTESVLNAFPGSAQDITPVIVFGGDGSVQEYIDEVEVDYSYAGPEPTIITSTIWGYLTELNGDPKSGIKITAQLYKNQAEFSNGIILDLAKQTVDTDINGYWEIVIVYNGADTMPKYIEFNINGEKNIKIMQYQSTLKYTEMIDL